MTACLHACVRGAWFMNHQQPSLIVARPSGHRNALRSTSRFSFAGVPNALTFELNLLRLLRGVGIFH
jgi:hypothetical protein